MKKSIVIASLIASSFALAEKDYSNKSTLDFIKSVITNSEDIKSISKQHALRYSQIIFTADGVIESLNKINDNFESELKKTQAISEGVDDFIDMLRSENAKANNTLYLIEQHKNSENSLSDLLSVKNTLVRFTQDNRSYITSLHQYKRKISDQLIQASVHYTSDRNQKILNQIEDLRSYIDASRVIYELSNIKLKMLEEKGDYHYTAVEQIKKVMVRQCELSKKLVENKILSLRDEEELIIEIENICSDIDALTENTYQSDRSLHFAIRRIKRRISALHRNVCNTSSEDFDENKCNIYTEVLSVSVSPNDSHLKRQLTCFEKYERILSQNEAIPSIPIDLNSESCLSDYQLNYDNTLLPLNGSVQFYLNSIQDRTIENLQLTCSEIQSRFQRQLQLDNRKNKILLELLDLLDLFIDEKIGTDEYLDKSFELEGEVFNIEWEMLENYPDYFYSDEVLVSTHWKTNNLPIGKENLTEIEFGPKVWKKVWGSSTPDWLSQYDSSSKFLNITLKTTPHEACTEKKSVYVSSFDENKNSSAILFEDNL